jgi:hypothetical protein
MIRKTDPTSHRRALAILARVVAIAIVVVVVVVAAAAAAAV